MSLGLVKIQPHTRAILSQYCMKTSVIRYMYTCMNLTIIQCHNHSKCRWSTSLTVTGRDGAIVGGGWCQPFQCEGACCCVLHGSTAPPISLRDTGEEVASDHTIALSRSRRGPRECNISRASFCICELLRGTTRSCMYVKV